MYHKKNEPHHHLRNQYHMRHTKRKKSFAKIVGISLVVIVVLSTILVILGYVLFRRMSVEDILQANVVQQFFAQQIAEDARPAIDFVPTILGFSESQTYLLLFLNNTELRPSGGFIGSYATVRVENGSADVLVMEGTESIDARAPSNFQEVPPDPIQQYLGIHRWYFRDSNWSPDFTVSADRAEQFYAAEGGVAADDIDAVIGITPTVLEHVLSLTGPITIQGITFTSENVIETLEYEVEYGYKKRGITFAERKQIMRPLLLEVLSKLKSDVLFSYNTYIATFETLATEKHILFAHTDDEIQSFVESQRWGGRVEGDHNGDYLMWVDANMGALKTDHAIDRSLTYTIAKRPASHAGETDRYLAAANMTYQHTGTFDWRTSRYQTYARVYVPKGSKLVSVIGEKRNGQALRIEEVAVGTELGKQWFGTFFTIEPGHTKSLEFIYKLPDAVVSHPYNLLVQKQSGTVAPPLTLSLDFATLLSAAEPAEKEEEWGDGVYTFETDLRVDRAFEVNF